MNKSILIPPKPANSRIILQQETEFLDIFIPCQGFRIYLLPIILFAIIWNGFLINWYWIALNTWNVGGWFFAFFALGHLAGGIWLTLLILFAIAGQIWLHLDQEKISLSYQLFGLNYNHSSPVARNQITKLIVNKTYYRKNSAGHSRIVKPQINIWAGSTKFNIGKGVLGVWLLSEIEIEWLAQKLSQWLDLPIISTK